MKVVLRMTKAIILIVLLAFFYYYFFLDVFTKFKSRRTNVATREELYKKEGTIKGIKSPAITVCLSPSQTFGIEEIQLDITNDFSITLPV